MAAAQPPKFEEPVIEKKAEEILAQQVSVPCMYDCMADPNERLMTERLQMATRSGCTR